MTIDASAVARVLGITTTFKDLRGENIVNLPQRIIVLAQGATANTYSTTKRRVTSAANVGLVEGYGSPAHLVMRELFPVNGDGVGTIPVTLFPLVDDAAGVAATGTITPSGTQSAAASYRVWIAGIRSEAFVVPAGAITVATVIASMITAINAVLEMPVIASDGTTVLDLTSKWEGVTANGLDVSVVGESLGVTFAVGAMTGGLVNPSITAALAQIGGIWETLGINAAMTTADSTQLDEIQTFGDGRWGDTVRKPMVFCIGETEPVVATAIVVPDARKTDKVNIQLVAPGSVNLPSVAAARQVARIAKVAQNNPPTDYGHQAATGIIPGTDAEQWTFIQRDQAVKGGSSTIEVHDGVVNVSDVVTMYHPTGEVNPAFRYLVDIVKLQNLYFNVDIKFATPEWDGAPLIPDDDATTNPNARKPRDAVSQLAQVIDGLGLAAILSNTTAAKKTLAAAIDGANPKRLNITGTVQLSGNSNIMNFDIDWGFFFGGLVAA